MLSMQPHKNNEADQIQCQGCKECSAGPAFNLQPSTIWGLSVPEICNMYLQTCVFCNLGSPSGLQSVLHRNRMHFICYHAVILLSCKNFLSLAVHLCWRICRKGKFGGRRFLTSRLAFVCMNLKSLVDEMEGCC